MQQALHERAFGRVEHVAIEQAEHIEDRNQANRVGDENEEEERQNQRRPGRHPFLPDVRLRNVVAHELDDVLERVHEAGRNQPLLLQIPPHHPRDRDEEDRGDEPQHEDVFRDREVDARNRRQVD